MSWKYYGVQFMLDEFNISNISTDQTSAVAIEIMKGVSGPIEYINSISSGWEVSDLA